MNSTERAKKVTSLQDHDIILTQLNELRGEINKLHQINNTLQETVYAQGKLLKSVYQSTLRGKIKSFISPKLGTLDQYPPKKMVIPARYKITKALTNAPVISIVTPSFNQADYLEKTLLSVIHQNYPALEFIVQDGGSTDHSAQIIKQYENHLKHSESKKDKGQSQAINLGFRHATGDIMAYLNSDDLLLQGSLHYIANYFSAHPEVDVVYGHRIVINKADEEIGRWILPPHDNEVLSWADFIPQETLFWRRSIWEKVGAKIDENFKFAMDWDLILRFREAGAKFVRLPRFLGAFRIHSSQKTLYAMSSTGLEEMNVLKYRCLGKSVTEKEIRKQLRAYLTKHTILHKLYRAGIIRY